MILANQSNYDPDEPEGGSYRSAYMTRKDVKWISAVFVIVILIFVPVYLQFKRQSEQTRCAQNFNGMFQAVSLYMQEHDEQFPPLFVEGDNGTPMLEKGKPSTWATLLQPLMRQRASFRCPSARPEELTIVEHPDGGDKVLELSYGMYVAMGTRYFPTIDNPSGNVLFSETSNMGSHDTYDPEPYKKTDGSVVPLDGFAICYDDSNSVYTEESAYVTRLAFYGSGKGNFKGDSVHSRHDKGIHVLFASGQLGFITPHMAQVQHQTPNLTGLWGIRKSATEH